MVKMNSRLVLVSLIVLVLFAAPVEATFVRSFLTIGVKINEDGSALIQEEIRFFMDTRDSVDLYKISLRTTNDISGWRNRLNLPDLRYHVDTSKMTVEDLKLQPMSPDTCNIERGTCYGTFMFEYTITKPEGNRGLVNITRYLRPRVIGYEVLVDRLILETSIVDEEYLADKTVLEIKLPEASSNIILSPRPTEYGQNDIPDGAEKLTWQGRIGLSKAELSFERKESLVSEVVGFFSQSQETVIGWITSKEGLALVGAALLILIGYVSLQRRNLSKLVK